MEVHSDRVDFPRVVRSKMLCSESSFVAFQLSMYTHASSILMQTLCRVLRYIYNKLFLSSKVIFRTKRRHNLPRQMPPKQDEHLACETDGDSWPSVRHSTSVRDQKQHRQETTVDIYICLFVCLFVFSSGGASLKGFSKIHGNPSSSLRPFLVCFFP